eukprot:2378551-Rhodomonas_salina.1
MSDSGDKNGEEANPCLVQQSSAMCQEGAQAMENEHPGMLGSSRECVERQLESLNREREDLVEEVKDLQARVSEVKHKLEVEDGILPHEQELDEHSRSRINRLEERAKAEEQRLNELLEQDLDCVAEKQPPS